MASTGEQRAGDQIPPRAPAREQTSTTPVSADVPAEMKVALPPDARRFLATLARIALRIAADSSGDHAA